MARKGYCAVCGREVWQGRDGGCQFGHPASEFSNAHDADPSVKAAVPAAAPAHHAPPPHRPAAPPPYAPPIPAAPQPPQPPPPQAPQPMATQAPQSAYEAAPAVGFVAGAAVPAVAQPVPAPADEGWGSAPDTLAGSAPSFDYTALSNEVSIGDTDCLVRRVIARVIDNLMLVTVQIILLVPFVLGVIAAAQRGPAGTPPATPSWVTPVMLLLYTAYFVLLPHYWKGRTLGKAICGIAVTDMHDQAPQLWQLAIRELAMILPDGLFNGILGLVVAAKSTDNQRFGDQWAGTVVVRTR